MKARLETLMNFTKLVGVHFVTHHYRWVPIIFATAIIINLNSSLDFSIQDYFYTAKCEGEESSVITENSSQEGDATSQKPKSKDPNKPKQERSLWYDIYVFLILAHYLHYGVTVCLLAFFYGR